MVLQPEQFKHFIDAFNATDRELYPATIPNAEAWPFLAKNIPLFDCPDQMLMEIYYFRWWTYRKHIKQTEDGFIITEFLPDVPWAGKHNSICCAAGFHFAEGRWLHERRYLDDYAKFWLGGGGDPRSYSFWIAHALWNRHLVTGDARQITELFPKLISNYQAWEQTNLGADGLFWQIDDRDGMEFPIGDNGYKPGFRPTINSYMYADAQAIANIAEIVGDSADAVEFHEKAAAIKRLVQQKLWDSKSEFFKVLPDRPGALLSKGRELLGYTPWFANLPDAGFASAWKELMNPQGFRAPFGLTTAEQRDPDFTVAYTGHECQWNGPTWPYATSITLTALENLLNDYEQPWVTKQDYYDLLATYARSQHLRGDNGTAQPWIDENLNPFTGEWLARAIKRSREGSIIERGKDYNHSTFCDLIISGLIGLRPRADDVIEVNPLIPEGIWDYFCLDHIPYHGRLITILYDKTGERYEKGKGMMLAIDGTIVARSDSLQRITAIVPAK